MFYDSTFPIEHLFYVLCMRIVIHGYCAYTYMWMCAGVHTEHMFYYRKKDLSYAYYLYIHPTYLPTYCAVHRCGMGVCVQVCVCSMCMCMHVCMRIDKYIFINIIIYIIICVHMCVYVG